MIFLFLIFLFLKEPILQRRVFDELDDMGNPKERFYDEEEYADGDLAGEDDQEDNLDVEEPTQPPPKNCNIPNTVRSYDGKCVCNQSYIGDNPIQERGCWKCEPGCNSQATCIYPGKCECAHGLIGDGIKYCVQPIPQLSSVEASNSQIPRIIARYTTQNQFQPFFAFCKFGDKIVNAGLMTENRIYCNIPNKNSDSKVSISFDGTNWTKSLPFSSQQELIVSQARQIPMLRKQIIIQKSFHIQTLLCVLCTALILFITFGKKPRRTNKV